MRLPLLLTGLTLLAGCSAPSHDAAQRASFDSTSMRPAQTTDRGWDPTALPASAVDKHVDILPGSKGPAYPKTLRDAKVEGEVSLRFVVDSTGLVDTSHVLVLSSTHRYFTDAVMAALPTMHFLPAEKGGRNVRQWVEQPFTFRLTP